MVPPVCEPNMYHRQQNKWYPQSVNLICTIASKINGTPKGVHLPISKLHSIVAVANLLTRNNKSQICNSGQKSLQSDTFGGNIYFAGEGTKKYSKSHCPVCTCWGFLRTACPGMERPAVVFWCPGRGMGDTVQSNSLTDSLWGGGGFSGE